MKFFQLIVSPVFPTGAQSIFEMMEVMEISQNYLPIEDASSIFLKPCETNKFSDEDQQMLEKGHVEDGKLKMDS